ncbi:MAG: DUF6314 family protein [Pseudomonadota bacterium]
MTAVIAGITLADFAGPWRLDRRIEDHRAGLTGVLTGTAEWTPDAHGLVYDEVGILRYGSAPPLRATRRYLWRENAHRLVVLFEDGRHFHAFTAYEGRAEHACPPDTYRVRYDFAAWPDWVSRWHVVGPRKDVQITSRYRRV